MFKDSNLERWTFNEGDFKSKHENRNNAPWCAFYTDTWHAVEPVKSGVRAVLQFDVSCKSEDASKENLKRELIQDVGKGTDEWHAYAWGGEVKTIKETKPLAAPANESLLKELMDAISKHEVNATNAIAIPLQYKYRAQCIVPHHLKRLDFDIFNALLNAGYKVALQPIEIELVDWAGYLVIFAEYELDGITVHSFGDLTSYYSKNKDSSDVHCTLFEKDANVSPSKVKFVGAGAEQKEFFWFYPYRNHVGNQAQEGRQKYFSGAMVIFK